MVEGLGGEGGAGGVGGACTSSQLSVMGGPMLKHGGFLSRAM